MTNGPMCSNCGRINRPNAKICSGCGKPLAVAPPSYPAPQQPIAPPRQPPVPPSYPAPQQPIAPPRQPPVSPSYPAPQSAPRQPTPEPHKRSRIAWWQVLLIVILLVLCACVSIAFFVGDRLLGFLAPPQPTAVPALTTPTLSSLPPPQMFTPTIAAPASVPVQPASTPSLMTATPTVTPTVAFVPDTSADTTLKPGETWRQQNMMLTLQKRKFAEVSCGGFLEFELLLENFEPDDIIVNWRGDDVTVKNDQELPFPQVLFQPSPATADCAKYIPLQGASFLPALGGRKTFGITVQVRGQLDDKVNKIFVVVAKAGRIQNARWEIPVPR